MMRLKTISFLLISISTVLFLASCEKKNYSVEIQDGSVHVTMHSPSMGIVGINQVSYDGFTYEEVEKEVFDKIRSRSYDGAYTVSVTLQYLDSYGNYYDSDRMIVSTLSAMDVKKYASYSYFKGQTHLEKAFPWNRENKTSSTNSGNNTQSSNTNSVITTQQSNVANFDFTGSWDCPNLYDGGMDICMTIIHNTMDNTVKVDYLVNYRLYTYDNATGWIEGNTLHIIQPSDDDGNFIEITATPINKKTIKGLLRYKNPYGSYDGKLTMNYQNAD